MAVEIPDKQVPHVTIAIAVAIFFVSMMIEWAQSDSDATFVQWLVAGAL